MQLRYSFRLYPNGPQRSALARALGCARVVYNDALRARETARMEGAPFPKTGDLSKLLITDAKKTDERGWLGEVSAVVLQQSLRDLDTAYRNFFDGLKGKRPRMGAPRFKSRRDSRQAVRFTANARWKITMGGDLSLPKIGDVRVKWSRTLPSTPSTVTVVKDAAGRYFASFVVQTRPEEMLPEVAGQVGIDLGLSHFAILSDGTKIESPRFLRRAEKKLKREQRRLARKAKGSNNRTKARIKVARTHTRVADARREFHHQLSTRIIRENQAVAVEDLAVKGLARTRLAKSVHSAGSSRPLRSAACAVSRTARSPYTSASGSAGHAGPSWTGTSTRRSTSPRPPDWRCQPVERNPHRRPERLHPQRGRPRRLHPLRPRPDHP